MMKLFIFPHAGGTKYSYQPFKNYFTPPLQVEIYEMPGRGAKAKEPLLYDINEMVDYVYNEIKSDLILPYSFLGHSFGSLLSFLLTKKIERENKSLPVHLFLSGRRGPYYLSSGEIPKSSLPRDEFVKLLEEMGGIPKEIVNDLSALDFFEPIIRADFAALEKYKYSITEKLNVPITILLGTNDKATHDPVVPWENETDGLIEFQYFQGGHFFIFQEMEKISLLVTRKLMTLIK